MFSESVIQPETIQVYRETEYRVTGEQSLVLRIAKYNKSLSRLYISNKVDSCAFITACNPCSKSLSDAANADRHNELGLELQCRGLKFFQGEGKHPLGDWPGEASYLILGLSLEAAKSSWKRVRTKRHCLVRLRCSATASSAEVIEFGRLVHAANNEMFGIVEIIVGRWAEDGCTSPSW